MMRLPTGLNPRERLLLSLLLSIGIFLLGYRGIVAGQIPQYLKLKTQLKEEEAKLASSHKFVDNYSFLREALAKEEEDLRNKIKFVLTLSSREVFFKAVQPQDPGVRILIFRPLPKEKRGNFDVEPYQVSVAGPYPGVSAYIKQVENLPGTEIRELKITTRSGSVGEVEATFLVDFYIMDINIEGEEKPLLTKGQAVTLFPSGRVDSFSPALTSQQGLGPQVNSGGVDVKGGPAQSHIAETSRPPVTQQPFPPGTREEPSPSPSPSPAPAPVYAFPSRDKSPGAPAPWLEGIRVLRNVGPFYRAGAQKIAIAGRKFNHGVVVEVSQKKPRVEAVLDLQAGYLLLKGFIGVEDETKESSGSFVLTLLGDERQLFKSPPQKPSAYPYYIEADVTGVNRLIIQIEWQPAGPGDYDRIIAALADMVFLTTK